MAPLTGPRVGILGLGAIGGSVALSLLERGGRPRGYTRYPGEAHAAAVAGVDVVESPLDVVRDADIVLIAVPLDVIADVAANVIDALDEHGRVATVLHTGSLQRAEAIRAEAPVWARIIGTHPIVGAHGVGFAAASAERFHGATVSVEDRADARQRADAELLWSMAGAARIAYDTADEHDRRMAWVSHLPQLAATATAATLSRACWTAAQLSPGARDATGLAENSFAMWLPIVDRAADDTIRALTALERSIAGVRELIQRRDWTALARLWEEARRWRDAGDPPA
jgi:prephenate dehydrogenase